MGSDFPRTSGTLYHEQAYPESLLAVQPISGRPTTGAIWKPRAAMVSTIFFNCNTLYL